MKKILALILFISANLTFANGHPLPTAPFVDIERYIGKWIVVSALPQFFTRNCIGQTAEYEIINSATISVFNTCLKKKSKVTTIKGQAVVKNTETNAELEVTFNNFFTRLFRVKGDYNIIHLDEDYKYVMVGSRDRKSLWIMSRTGTMPQAELSSYIELARKNNFPVNKLIRY